MESEEILKLLSGQLGQDPSTLVWTWRDEAPPSLTFPQAHRTQGLMPVAWGLAGGAGSPTSVNHFQLPSGAAHQLEGEEGLAIAFQRPVASRRSTGMVSGHLDLFYGKGMDPTHSSSSPELLALS